MDEQEFHELYLEALNSISDVWELWISVTFAVIVAAYLGRAVLTVPLVRLLLVFYLAMSLLLTMRYIGYGQMSTDLINRMLEAGVTPLSHSLSTPIFMLSLTIMVAGSFASAWFLVRSQGR